MGAQVVAYLKHSSAGLRDWQQDGGASLYSHFPYRSVSLASELEWRRSAGPEGSQRLAQWGKVAHDSFPFLGSGSDRLTSSQGACWRNNIYEFSNSAMEYSGSSLDRKKNVLKTCPKYVNNAVRKRCDVRNV